MMKVSEIEEIQYSRNGFKPHVKSPIIWGRKGGMISPLCYLTKPKSVTVEDWYEFLDAFRFEIMKK
jgi:hypothetical protein